MMKNPCFKTFLLLTAMLLICSCSKFESINTNPETPEKVRSSMIATRIILNLAHVSSQKSFMQPYILTKQIAWSELAEAYQFNGFGTMAMSLTAINDGHFMGHYADSEELANAYNGLYYFARAQKFYDMTMALGDIPYKEALLGEVDKVYFPKYDTQKDVFLGILEELELADAFFAKGKAFAGDPIYAGDILQWRKLVNSFTLQVLMQLSKKDADSELNIKQRFAEIVKNKPLFSSNADNFQLIRSDKSGQTYPFFKVSNNFVIYPMLSSEIIDRLKANKDRRLFFYAKPSQVKIENGFLANDFNAYVGVDPSLPFSDLAAIKTSNDYSMLNDRYTELVTGEPTQIFGYAHFCFVLAEAAARGWINDDAAIWYGKGITSSMTFIAENTPNKNEFTHDMPMDNAYISAASTAYVNAFPVHAEQRIEQIITQKYLASYLQAKMTPYYDYRRTGYPKWKINPESSMNADAPDKMPVRWRYPRHEYNFNGENLNKAIEQQYQGVDDVNKVMWLLK